FMLAGIPFALVRNLADIRPVLEDVVDGASRELRLRLPPDTALGVDLLDHAVKRQVLGGVEMEDALDVGGLLRVRLDDAPPILADVAVAVGSQADEPAFADAA